MSSEYFLSRSELIKWVNDLLALNVQKVEEFHTGAVHCQLMDAVHPGRVPMGKVNFTARQPYEIVSNYKVLQKSFDLLKVDKPVDVQKLMKGKYQDNLEFLQWMKGYFDKNFSGQEYDAVARRAGSKGGAAAFGEGGGGGGGAAEGGRPQSRGAKSATGGAGRVPLASRNSPTKGGGRQPRRVPAKPASSAALAAAEAKVKQMTEENLEMKLAVDGLERERDFYFGKLRDIEILCQDPKVTEQSCSELVGTIQKILYATEEDFVSPEGEGGDGAGEEI